MRLRNDGAGSLPGSDAHPALAHRGTRLQRAVQRVRHGELARLLRIAAECPHDAWHSDPRNGGRARDQQVHPPRAETSRHCRLARTQVRGGFRADDVRALAGSAADRMGHGVGVGPVGGDFRITQSATHCAVQCRPVFHTPPNTFAVRLRIGGRDCRACRRGYAAHPDAARRHAVTDGVCASNAVATPASERSKRAMSRVGEESEDGLLMSLTGSSPNDIEEDVVSKGSGLSRGDKRRNAKLAELRRLVAGDHAILGIDLADEKQVVVVCDHDSRVLARQTVRVKAWNLGSVLEWAARIAHRHGFAGVTVGCEPTGHRWMVLNQLATQRDMTLVCVNPMLVGRAREAEDYTRDKSDDKDAMLIARLVGELHCYVPERADETWARLRQLFVFSDTATT